MNNIVNPIRVRFAPSPTGHLHLGGLRAALFNWLFAKSNNGKFLLRIEDTDLQRSSPEYTKSILDAFDWVNIKSDEPIVIQSKRIKEHMAVANELISKGFAYKCYCTEAQMEKRLASVGGGFTKYDQYCLLNRLKSRDIQSSRMVEDPGNFTRENSEENNPPYAIRFKIPENREFIEFNDLIRGKVVFHRDQLDDFIIVRSDGTPMYNFVVVIDDAFMKISHVLRGDDHISNTPKQILLYEACGYKMPEFGHLPMILGPDGNRLSKRDAATSVLDYKDNGFLPDALCNYLVRLGWSHGDQEIFTRDEMVKYFSLDNVGKSGAIFDIKKLEWTNGVYIRQLESSKILAILEDSINFNYKEKLSNWTAEKIIKCIDLFKDRVKTLVELVNSLELIYSGPRSIDDSELLPYKDVATNKNLNELIIKLENLEVFSSANISDTIKALAKKLEIDLPQLAKPLRVALTGHSSSPSVFEITELVGKQEACSRLKKFLKTDLQER